jgi:hypothetical protein
MVGPREIILKVLEKFAIGIKEDTRCELVARKCRMYNMDKGAWGVFHTRDLIP